MTSSDVANVMANSETNHKLTFKRGSLRLQPVCTTNDTLELPAELPAPALLPSNISDASYGKFSTGTDDCTEQ